MTPDPPRRSNRPPGLVWYWAPAVLFMAAVFAGSSVPKPPAFLGAVSDKTLHFGEYAVLGLLLARGLAGPRWPSLTFACAAAAVAVAAIYGVSDEYHQLFVPGRQYDVRDMMADALGASASAGGLWAWGIIRRFWRLRRETTDHAVRTSSTRT